MNDESWDTLRRAAASRMVHRCHLFSQRDSPESQKPWKLLFNDFVSNLFFTSLEKGRMCSLILSFTLFYVLR